MHFFLANYGKWVSIEIQPGWLRITLQRKFCSVFHPKRRAVFRPVFSLVIHPGTGDIGVSQPLLDFGNIGIVLQGICRRRGPQGVNAEAAHIGIDAHLLAPSAEPLPGRPKLG